MVVYNSASLSLVLEPVLHFDFLITTFFNHVPFDQHLTLPDPEAMEFRAVAAGFLPDSCPARISILKLAIEQEGYITYGERISLLCLIATIWLEIQEKMRDCFEFS